MADILRIKRRISGAPGAPASLANAEIAYNEVDHTLYYGEGTGGAGGTATVVVPIGGSGLASNATPLMDGTAAPGASAAWSRGDHVHPSDTTKANLANPTFTGTVTVSGNLSVSGTVSGAGFTAMLLPYAPLASPIFTGAPSLPTGSIGVTQAPGNSSTALATTAFVTAAGNATVVSFNTRTGAVVLLLADVTGVGGAPLASPSFTGTVTIGGTITGAGMTAWSAAPGPIGSTTASSGAFTTLSATGAVSGAGFTTLLAPYAPLASPVFTGTPSLPSGTIAVTQPNGTNNTTPATTAYVLATRQDQFQPPNVDVSWNSHRITNLLDPQNPQDASTKNYVDNAINGIVGKAPCRVATTGSNLAALSGLLVIDGITTVAGDRVLVKDQTTQSANGVYIAAAGAWARSTDTNTWAELVSAYVFVEVGAVNSDNGYLCTVDPGGTLGTTAVTWVQFSGAGQVIAGNGLSKVGNTLSVVGTAGQIAVGAAVSIDPTYVGQPSITTLGSVATGTWNATTVAVARGGTGATTLTGYLVGNGTGAFTAVASIPSSGITGLGTMSTQNANAVAITGGTIDGVTFDCGTF
jgi:hypothetical protein